MLHKILRTPTTLIRPHRLNTLLSSLARKVHIWVRSLNSNNRTDTLSKNLTSLEVRNTKNPDSNVLGDFSPFWRFGAIRVVLGGLKTLVIL